MDDMVFQNNSKNAIYVLNTGYDSYGEFGSLNIFGSPTIHTNDYPPPAPPPAPPASKSHKSPNEYSSCSPATSALQKLFNCSSSGSNTSNTVSHCCNNLLHGSDASHSNDLGHPPLTSLGSSKSWQSNSCGTRKGTTASTTKSTLIAKKETFWKYLEGEEEKWRKLSIENLSTTNCERDRTTSSHDEGKSSSRNYPSANGNQSTNHNKIVNNYCSIFNNNSASRSADSNNQKSSTEMYKEAAQLLGLSCTLCDNCRCLDCQSRYFDCDDSDSFSELSFMDDDDDQFVNYTIDSNEVLASYDCVAVDCPHEVDVNAMAASGKDATDCSGLSETLSEFILQNSCEISTEK